MLVREEFGQVKSHHFGHDPADGIIPVIKTDDGVDELYPFFPQRDFPEYVHAGLDLRVADL